jgi:hypothetical protein
MAHGRERPLLRSSSLGFGVLTCFVIYDLGGHRSEGVEDLGLVQLNLVTWSDMTGGLARGGVCFLLRRPSGR